MEKENEIFNLIEELNVKYANSGQDLVSYLKGLLEANFEPYWEYINLDSLLAIQQPKTNHPDEIIFISYHQITELYFKLILHEQKQICFHTNLTSVFMEERLERIIRYIQNLTNSFEIMILGMDYHQFLKFRMALLPASGFQSAQFRMIEIAATDIANLIKPINQVGLDLNDIEQIIPFLYWKAGAIQLDTAEKTLTLQQFENKYNRHFLRFSKKYHGCNTWQKYLTLKNAGLATEKLTDLMRKFDYSLNVEWSLAHFKSAVKYLKSPTAEVAATGGTNWGTYLPPRFQKIKSFPQLWTEEEKENWGKEWVQENVIDKK